MGKETMKRIRTMLIILMAAIFLATSFGLAQADTFQIQPKGKKKIKIGVLDLISSIETSAMACSYYRKLAKDRGWELQVFDMGMDYSKAQAIMENMITAGYDAIIVNWTDFHYYDKQIWKAHQKGIPVQGIACGNMVPGVISHGISADMAFGSLSGLYLMSKLHEGDKILAFYDPRGSDPLFRFKAAKVVFDMYKIKIAQELHFPGSGDPSQVCYEMIKNALLADSTKKEIKGIWTHWEGYGIPAARAAIDMGRKDIIVVTNDCSHNTYKALRELPTLLAAADAQYDMANWTSQLFKNLDIIFAGKPMKEQAVWFSTPVLITKDNLPPPGYLYSTCGYKGRAPDYKVK
jgi:ABC-type sugar transport system substrate-binding protein